MGRLWRAGAIQPLVALVRDGDAEGKANAAGALRNLAGGGASFKAAIVAAGGGGLVFGLGAPAMPAAVPTLNHDAPTYPFGFGGFAFAAPAAPSTGGISFAKPAASAAAPPAAPAAARAYKWFFIRSCVCCALFWRRTRVR